MRLRWLVNAKERRIHDDWELDERCPSRGRMDDAKDVRRVGTREMRALLLEGFDLCDWCWPDREE